jgi:hypothetical protein
MAWFWAHLFQVLVWLGFLRKPEFIIRTVVDHPTPETMNPGILYVVGGKGFMKWAYLRCPAKIDEVIQLSLQPNRRPRWELVTDIWGRPTITPSVRQLEGSYAHFWMRNGKVDWCADSGKPPIFKTQN